MFLKSRSSFSRDVSKKSLRKLNPSSNNSKMNPILLTPSGKTSKESLIFTNSAKSKENDRKPPKKSK